MPYLWPRPGSDDAVSKYSFVQGFKPWGWIIGAGVYTDDIEAQFWDNATNALADIAEMRQIEDPHAELHRVIKDVIKHHHDGRKEEAEQGLKKVGQLSEGVVNLLETIRQKHC